MNNVEDLYWLALNVYHEARGESDEGQRAVCHVVLNRARSRKQSVKQVVLAPSQFSWTLSINPLKHKVDIATFRKCLLIAEEISDDQSDGYYMAEIDHYFNPNIVRPKWASAMTFVKTIGNHSFYRDDRQMRFK